MDQNVQSPPNHTTQSKTHLDFFKHAVPLLPGGESERSSVHIYYPLLPWSVVYMSLSNMIQQPHTFSHHATQQTFHTGHTHPPPGEKGIKRALGSLYPCPPTSRDTPQYTYIFTTLSQFLGSVVAPPPTRRSGTRSFFHCLLFPPLVNGVYLHTSHQTRP